MPEGGELCLICTEKGAGKFVFEKEKPQTVQAFVAAPWLLRVSEAPLGAAQRCLLL